MLHNSCMWLHCNHQSVSYDTALLEVVISKVLPAPSRVHKVQQKTALDTCPIGHLSHYTADKTINQRHSCRLQYTTKP